MRSVDGRRTRQPWYLVRYLGYEEAEWQEGNLLREDVPKLVEKFFYLTTSKEPRKGAETSFREDDKGNLYFQ